VETARPTGFDAERELTLKLGGRDCDVHIVCEPDNERPTVKDETGEYLEQKAQLEITCGDETIVNRTFTKDDFERYLSKDEAARLVIQGMLIDPSKTSTVIDHLSRSPAVQPVGRRGLPALLHHLQRGQRHFFDETRAPAHHRPRRRG